MQQEQESVLTVRNLGLQRLPRCKVLHEWIFIEIQHRKIIGNKLQSLRSSA